MCRNLRFLYLKINVSPKNRGTKKRETQCVQMIKNIHNQSLNFDVKFVVLLYGLAIIMSLNLQQMLNPIRAKFRCLPFSSKE